MSRPRVFGGIALLTACLLPCVSIAGGTLEFAQVEKLLREQPATYRWLSSTLVFPSGAWAEIRLGSHFPALGGVRIGPYSFIAERKGEGSASRVEVMVCTRYRFLDANGIGLPETQIEKATQIDEHLLAVLVRDPQQDATPLLCPQ